MLKIYCHLIQVENKVFHIETERRARALLHSLNSPSLKSDPDRGCSNRKNKQTVLTSLNKTFSFSKKFCLPLGEL